VGFQEILFEKNKKELILTEYSEEVRFQIIKKIRDLLSVIKKKNPLTYTYFWKNFGHLLKMGVCQEKKYIGIFAHLFLFSSTFSLVFPISISDYVKRMKKEQNVIYYLILNNRLQGRKHPVLEKMKFLDLEVILVENYFEELLLKEIETKQQNKNRKKLIFLNIGLFEFSRKLPCKKNPLKNKNSEKNFDEFKKWYKGLLREKVLGVFITPNLFENVSNFSNTRLQNPYFFDKISVAHETSQRKSFFLLQEYSNIFEINSSDHLVELLSFISKGSKNQTITKEIGILLWEITYLNCSLEIPDRSSFIKRVRLITITLLILITPLENSKMRKFILNHFLKL